MLKRSIEGDWRAELAQAGDHKAMEWCLAEVRPVAVGIAMQAKIPGVSVDDLVQEAMIAAVRAVRTYKPGNQGLKGYARLVIGNAMRDQARRAWRVPLNVSLEESRTEDGDCFADHVEDPASRAAYAETLETDAFESKIVRGAIEREEDVRRMLAGEPGTEELRSVILAEVQHRKQVRLATRVRKGADQPSLFGAEAEVSSPLASVLIRREIALAQVRALLLAGLKRSKVAKLVGLNRETYEQVMDALRAEFA